MPQPDVSHSLGLRVRALREARGLTQERLAGMLDADQSHVAQIESGSRNLTIRNIRRIADCLCITLADFFDDDIFRDESTWTGAYAQSLAGTSADATAHALSAKDRSVLEAIRGNPTANVAAIARTTGVSVSTANRVLARLRASGYVRREGSRKTGRWVVVGDEGRGDAAAGSNPRE